MIDQQIVAAVFATMNRKETALTCVRALASQSRPPDLVVISDNVSIDGTADALKNLQDLPFPLIIHPMSENLGNAGGVEEAMEIAFAKKMDAVWILDDDSWPRADALQNLLAAPWQDHDVRHSIQIDPKSGDLTWPMQVFDEQSGWCVIDSMKDINGQMMLVTRNNWTGSLVSRYIREKVGPVLGDLFIRGEDEEYPWRFLQNGITQRAIISSILDHPGPIAIEYIDLLGKRIYYEPGLADWKLYYKVRNMVWLQRRKRNLLSAVAMCFAYVWTVSRIDGLHRLPLILEATRDGLLGCLGRWKKHPF